MRIPMNPRRRVTLIVTGIATVAIAIGTVAGMPAIADMFTPPQQEAAEKTAPVAHALTAEEMTELLQTATFAGDDVAPTEGEDVSLTLENGHIVVTERTDADGAVVAEHLAYRPAALMREVALAEKGAEDGATDLTYVVIDGEGATQGAVTVSPDSDVTADAGRDDAVTPSDAITGSDGWILDEDVTEGAGLEPDQSTGGETPTLPNGDAITLPEKPAEEPTEEPDDEGPAEPTGDASSNATPSNDGQSASTDNNQSTPPSNDSSSNQASTTAPEPEPAPEPAPHVHHWTNAWVVPTYETFTYETTGETQQVLKRNDYYHSCDCGYSELYDTKTY